jgi:hypothetical protein
MCAGHLIFQVNLKFSFEKSTLCFFGNDLNKMRSSKASLGKFACCFNKQTKK